MYLRSLVSDLRFFSTFCVFISQKLRFLMWTRKCTFLKKGFLNKFSFHVHIYQIKIKMASIVHVSVVFHLVKWHICSLKFLFMKIQGLMFPLSMTVIEGSFIPFHIKSFYCKAGNKLGARCWHHYFPLHLDNVWGISLQWRNCRWFLARNKFVGWMFSEITNCMYLFVEEILYVNYFY